MSLTDLHADVWRRGVVKWYDRAKSYGFIMGDDGKDVFLHLGAVQKSRVKPVDIQGGARVEFTATKAPNKKLSDVTLIRLLE